MPTEPLSGRELEIAVAKALGWTCTTHADDWHNVMGPDNEWGADGETVADAWEQGAPKYLTDPVAFDEAMKALDAGGDWTLTKEMGKYIALKWRGSRGIIAAEATGATYREAACRCLVAWKGQPR